MQGTETGQRDNSPAQTMPALVALSGSSSTMRKNGKRSLEQSNVTVQPERCLLAALEPWPFSMSMKSGRCSTKQCNVTVCITCSVRSSYVPPWLRRPPPPPPPKKKKNPKKKPGRNSLEQVNNVQVRHKRCPYVSL